MNIEIKLPSIIISRTIPDGWNDCSPELAMTLLQILQLDGPNILAKRISAMQAVLQVREPEWRQWEAAYIADYGEEDGKLIMAADIERLLDMVGWLLKETDASREARILDPSLQPVLELNPELTKCPLPEINLEFKPPTFPRRNREKTIQARVPLYAAPNELAGITGEELAHLFDAYEAYAANPTDDAANWLLAILYRKSKEETPDEIENEWYGDRRHPLQLCTVPYRAAAIGAQVPAIAKNVMLFWFLSCRMKIISDWKVVFQRSEEVRKSGPDFKWWGVYMAILDDPTKIDDFAKKVYTDLFTTIAWYDTKAKEAEMKSALEI